MKKNNDRAGFSAIEVVLVVILLVVVSGVSYYVYQANATATDIYNAASNSSSTPVIKTKKSVTTVGPSSDVMQSHSADSETLQNTDTNTLKGSNATL